MKHIRTLLRSLVASAAVFALTFTAGFGTSTALLQQMDTDSSVLGAMIVRSAYRGLGSVSSASSRMTVKARAIRGVKRAVIVRPRTRTGTGSSSRVAVSSAPKTAIKASCGDKLVIKDLGEECDDGNALNSDGCSSLCKVEAGFYCGGMPSECIARCGAGVVTPTEKCDDSNTESGDGCSASCKTEFGYTCTGTPSFCEPTPYCGDGVKASTEQCDDGNSNIGDGCYNCKTE